MSASSMWPTWSSVVSLFKPETEGHGAEVFAGLGTLWLAEGSGEEMHEPRVDMLHEEPGLQMLPGIEHEPSTGLILAELNSELHSAKEMLPGLEILPVLYPGPRMLPEGMVLPWFGPGMLPSVLLTMRGQLVGSAQR